jgi:hypothetical protein
MCFSKQTIAIKQTEHVITTIQSFYTIFAVNGLPFFTVFINSIIERMPRGMVWCICVWYRYEGERSTRELRCVVWAAPWEHSHYMPLVRLPYHYNLAMVPVSLAAIGTGPFITLLTTGWSRRVTGGVKVRTACVCSSHPREVHPSKSLAPLIRVSLLQGVVWRTPFI